MIFPKSYISQSYPPPVEAPVISIKATPPSVYAPVSGEKTE